MKTSNNSFDFFKSVFEKHIEVLDKCIEDLRELRTTIEQNAETCALMDVYFEQITEAIKEEDA